MKLIKPNWVNHSGFPIFSIDVHPDGTRLATGGGDNKIKIWSIAPISLAEVESDQNTPKLLKSIDSHYSPVNSVKWSRDGKYLASGSDDKLCMIWGLSSSTLLGAKDSVENWICVSTLRGHQNDISEISWSPDNKFIATCSFDKTIIIWETTKFQMVHKLEEHTGFIKGLTWDPLSRYLASQSEDQSLIIWRTSDWQVEAKITEPFQHTGSSFFRRLSWSPDGLFICASHGINSSTHTGVIIQRSNWTRGLDLVGHRKAVVVSRYSPIIYKSIKSPDDKFCVILLGGQDMTVSLWSSMSARSLLIAKNMFEQGVQDISWCPDGYSFVACSTDGSIAYISLDPEEIGGVPVTSAEKRQLFQTEYGDAVQVDKNGNIVLTNNIATASNSSMAMLPENPDQLAMEDSMMIDSAHPLSNGNGSHAADSSVNTTPVKFQPTEVARQNQKQTVMSNGKRRITPLHIGGSSSQSITKPLPLSLPTHLQHSATKEANGGSHLPPSPSLSSNQEPIPFNLSPAKPSSSSNTTTISTPPLGKSPFKESTTSTAIEEVSPIPDKAIQPTSSSSLKIGSAVSSRINSKSTTSPVSSSSSSTTATNSTTTNTATTTTSTTSSNKKRKTVEPEPVVTQKKVKNKSSSSSSNANTSTTTTSQPNTNYNQIISTVPSVNFSIPLPVHSNHISKQLLSSTLSNANRSTSLFGSQQQQQSQLQQQQLPFIIDIVITEQELPNGTIEYFSLIKCISGEISQWENKIHGRVTLLAGNRNWCAVSNSDAILNIFNKNGSILMSNLVLRNQVSFLESNQSNHLLVITCDGFVSVWNVSKRCAELVNRELPFLPNRNNLTIKHAFVTEGTGKPIVVFSNGDSFVYSKDMGEWIKINDRLGSLSELNSAATTSTNTTGGADIGILSKVQQLSNNNTNNQIQMSSLLALTQSNTDQQQQQISTTFIEKQIWLATVLESQSEYKHWLLTYVKYLTKNGNILKLQDLCTELLGPSSQQLMIHNNSNSSNSNSNSNDDDLDVYSDDQNFGTFNNSPWEPRMLGLSKRALLKELFPIMGGNRNLQRLVGQFKESLNSFSKSTTNLVDPFDFTSYK
ncbi:hypothetical protein CYY_006534 [Polysphondylium violaceum]|uniref:Protein HIRA n=1 Tax=Polysphondylium violaceum TaxID=133409 RepID=A0A8J4PR78_9MYCE|nr:hypothetical protein CYY_006534 [Polysphondylium violaceum]